MSGSLWCCGVAVSCIFSLPAEISPSHSVVVRCGVGNVTIVICRKIIFRVSSDMIRWYVFGMQFGVCPGIFPCEGVTGKMSLNSPRDGTILFCFTFSR